MKIPTERTERIIVNPFGSTDFQVRALNVVNLKIHGLSSNAVNYVEAFTVPTICAPLSGQVMEAAKSNYEHLKNLAFADSNSNNEELEVDVLIGANHIWDFSNGNIKQGKDGPVAVETTLGWVLNGPVQMQVSSVSNQQVPYLLMKTIYYPEWIR